MEKQSSQPSNILFSCLVLTLPSLPFAICDLYFSFCQRSLACLTLPILNTKITFNFGTWLMVNGFAVLALSLILITVALLIWRRGTMPYYSLFFTYLITLMLATMFRVSWTIVGGLMYFGYLEGSCGEADTYMTLTVGMGIIWVALGVGVSRVRADMEFRK